MQKKVYKERTGDDTNQNKKRVSSPHNVDEVLGHQSKISATYVDEAAKEANRNDEASKEVRGNRCHPLNKTSLCHDPYP